MTEQMTISNGIVYIEEGTVSNVSFNNCQILLGKNVSLVACSIDSSSTVQVNG